MRAVTDTDIAEPRDTECLVFVKSGSLIAYMQHKVADVSMLSHARCCTGCNFVHEHSQK